MAYVDDHQTYNSNKDPMALDKRITHVCVANQWYNYSGMIVNASEHQAMVVGTTDCQFSFTVKPSIDMFGMNIDNTLSFDNNTSTIYDKINKQFNVMLRCHKLISKDSTDKFEALNKHILGFILKDYSSPYSQLLVKVNCISIYTRQLQNMLILLYESLYRKLS